MGVEQKMQPENRFFPLMTSFYPHHRQIVKSPQENKIIFFVRAEPDLLCPDEYCMLRV